MAAKAGHLYLIDGSAYIFRAYHALPPMNRPDGTPVNAVLGFCNMLEKLLDDLSGENQPTHLAVIFDAARKTFRNDIYPEYKAHRPPPPEDLRPQFEIVKDASRAFNVATIEMGGFEADDIIATYSRLANEAGMETTIVSSDKDLMQLVGGGVEMYDPMKSRQIRDDQVFEKFGVGPDKVVDVQALCGDSTDNVPGVPGIGVKTAALLINEYGDLDTLLERAGEIKQKKRRENLIEFADLARVSRELVRLRLDVPVEGTLDDVVMRDRDFDMLFEFLGEQSFRTLATKIASRNNVEAPEIADASGAPSVAAENLSDAGRDYVCVTEMADLEAWVAKAIAAGEVAVDTETTSLDAMQAELVGVSLAIKPGEACYIPLAHKAPVGQATLDLGDGGDSESQAPEQLDRDAALAVLQPMLEDAGVLKIGQNIKYDLLILARYGIDVTPIDDTMLLSYVLEGGLHGHGMDELSRLHFDISPVPFKEVAGSRQVGHYLRLCAA